MATYLPAPKEIRDLLTELLGREVAVSPSAPLAATPRNPCTVGVYVDDSLQVVALVVTDLPLSAYVGAAIGLVPVGGATQAIEEGALGETLRENLYEVLNISAASFNAEGADHVRLYDVHHAGDALPPDILARSLTLGRREDLAVDVQGYGSGRIAVVLV